MRNLGESKLDIQGIFGNGDAKNSCEDHGKGRIDISFTETI